MTALLLPVVAGAALLLLAGRGKAVAREPDRGDRDDGIDANRRKRKPKAVRVERRPAERKKLRPPLKPSEGAKRVNVVQKAKARAVVVDKAEKLTAKRAATQLRGYLRLSGDFGLPTPSPRIAALQRVLGVPATGQIDSATRTKCAALGVPLPGMVKRGSEPAPKKQIPVTRAVKRTTTGNVLQRHEEVKPDKGRAPRYEVKAQSTSPKMFAQKLADHFRAGGSPGFKGAPSADVGRAQRGMAAGLDVDGLYGDKTRSAAVALGVSMPTRAQAVAAFKAKNGDAAKPAAAAATPKAAADPALAARALAAYLEQGGSPGYRGKPAKPVSDAQRGMGGGIAVDGIYGEETRGRAAELDVTIGPRASFVKAG